MSFISQPKHLSDSRPPAVVAENLSIGYDGQEVVGGISLRLQAGHGLALVGTNGSGKSTVLKTLLGLQPSLGGRLVVLGTAPGTKPVQVAYLGQTHRTAAIAPVRVIDVVRSGRYARLGLLRRFGAGDHQAVANAIESMGIAHLSDSSMSALSGGQRQRAFLAQVVAHEADLLLLDEPTSGLDVAGTELYHQMVASARQRGASVITATHDISEAATFDEVLLLNRRVVAHGAPNLVLTAERLMDTFGIALRGVAHGDHHDLVLGAHPHGHEHGHDHAQGHLPSQGLLSGHNHMHAHDHEHDGAHDEPKLPRPPRRHGP